MRQYFDKKHLPLYIVLFVIFRYLFVLIPPLVIKNLITTPHVIDANVFERWAFFKTDYILNAWHTYDHKAYWTLYFPLDTVFPFVYSLLFMSAADYVVSCKRLYSFLSRLILAGAVVDLAENLSFGIFLGSGTDYLAHVVSFFSTVKTLLFAANCILALLVPVGYKLFVKYHRRPGCGNVQ